MRRLGLDIGKVRIGVSISDEEGIIAFPLETLKHVSKDKDISAIRKIVEDRNVGEVIIGLPLDMKGTPGVEARHILDFTEELKKNISQDVKVWDERLSTLQIERDLINHDISRSNRRKNIDKLAAQLILQSYLDSVGRTSDDI
ncbi:MAG: hypothetical protein AUJ75_04090 [Candidatus Omnitrophica bacterium CG1_02_49_10]|nr:MAG: hypothetical protein AUJ75_04090 [Candidatus Omnitrophica bacterium CG1_02_49_10]